MREKNRTRRFIGSWAGKSGKSLPSAGHHALELATLARRQLGAACPRTASEAPWPLPQQMWSAGSNGSWEGENQGELSAPSQKEQFPFETICLNFTAEGTLAAPSLFSFVTQCQTHMHCEKNTIVLHHPGSIHKSLSHLPALSGTAVKSSAFSFL